jgi:5-methylcytosine-specific restriction endonuclease McrA
MGFWDAPTGHVPYRNRPSIPSNVRDAVLNRAMGLCEDCGLANRLELHHETYAHVGRESPDELTALCRSCHRRRHIDLLGDWWNDPEEMKAYWAVEYGTWDLP